MEGTNLVRQEHRNATCRELGNGHCRCEKAGNSKDGNRRSATDGVCRSQDTCPDEPTG